MAHDVLASHQQRNRRRLNRRGLLEPKFINGLEQLFGIAKLNIDIGTKESLEMAKKKLAEVTAEPKSQWNQKFDAMYFAAVADIVGKDFDAAQKDMAAVSKFMKDIPAGDATVQKGAEAAVKMLEYRIYSAQAEATARVQADLRSAISGTQR